MELLRRTSSPPIHSVSAALALADATAETASARRRRRALDAVHDAKKQLLEAELARGLAAEELGRLQVEIHDTVLAQKANEKAVARARAES
jgi:hypothetical protein